MSDEIKEVETSAETSTPEVKGEVTYSQSDLDRLISKSVDKYKETTYRKDLEQGIAKALNDRDTKTPAQLEMESIRKELETERNLRIQNELAAERGKNHEVAMKRLAEAGLPVELADFVASEDSNKTTESLDSLTTVLSGLVTKTKQNVIDGNNVKVPSKSANSTTETMPTDGTKEEIKAWIKKNTNLV